MHQFKKGHFFRLGITKKVAVLGSSALDMDDENSKSGFLHLLEVDVKIKPCSKYIRSDRT